MRERERARNGEKDGYRQQQRRQETEKKKERVEQLDQVYPFSSAMFEFPLMPLYLDFF